MATELNRLTELPFCPTVELNRTAVRFGAPRQGSPSSVTTDNPKAGVTRFALSLDLRLLHRAVITLDGPPWKEGIKESFSTLSAPDAWALPPSVGVSGPWRFRSFPLLCRHPTLLSARCEFYPPSAFSAVVFLLRLGRFTPFGYDPVDPSGRPRFRVPSAFVWMVTM